jgi:uncharacterized protein with HEPN domain
LSTFNDYFGVDYEIVWDVAAHRIPELHEKIAAILAEPDRD